jgi:hypothetical protein
MSPHFAAYCEILRKHVPFEQRGLWCNHPRGKGKLMRDTFNPAYSNLNCHLSREAFDEFKRDWPESHPFGLDQDSRHSPVHLAMKDVVADEGQRWDLISECDLNKYWSAMIGVFRGELRAWFCEVAGAQAMLHQGEPDYLDTGLRVDRLYDDGEKRWWQLPMYSFVRQVIKHCHECGVPLRGYGQLSQATEGVEQTSLTHLNVYRPKRPRRSVQVVTELEQLGVGRLARVTEYLQNGAK